MARVFSGIQPTGDMHLGNLLGAVRNWVAALDGPEATPVGHIDFDPYTATTEALGRQMIPWSFALNTINRSMGQPDLYPFHLSPAITAKIDYVNRLIAKAAGRAIG